MTIDKLGPIANSEIRIEDRSPLQTGCSFSNLISMAACTQEQVREGNAAAWVRERSQKDSASSKDEMELFGELSRRRRFGLLTKRWSYFYFLFATPLFSFLLFPLFWHAPWRFNLMSNGNTFFWLRDYRRPSCDVEMTTRNLLVDTQTITSRIPFRSMLDFLVRPFTLQSLHAFDGNPPRIYFLGSTGLIRRSRLCLDLHQNARLPPLLRCKRCQTNGLNSSEQHHSCTRFPALTDRSCSRSPWPHTR